MGRMDMRNHTLEMHNLNVYLDATDGTDTDTKEAIEDYRNGLHDDYPDYSSEDSTSHNQMLIAWKKFHLGVMESV